MSSVLVTGGAGYIGSYTAKATWTMGAPAPVMNLGSGQGITVSEVKAVVESVSGLSVPYLERPRRPGDAIALYASADRRNLLGWNPELSDLRQIVETAWRWYSSR